MRRALFAGAVAAHLPAIIAPGVASAGVPRWSAVPTESPAGVIYRELRGVACSSAAACTAVGDFDAGNGRYVALTERWNGTAFTMQPLPSPPPRATRHLPGGVSCPAATPCTAVGCYETPNGD